MSIELELLEYSYWEHFKALKDVSLILPIDHPKRKLLEKTVNELQARLYALKQKEK